MIAFPCPACGRQLTIQGEFAGKRCTCPHCKKTLQVPAAASAPERTLASSPAAPAVAPPAGFAETVTKALIGDTPSSPEVGAAQLDFLAPPQQAEELGRLGAYRVLKVLGAGGMGMVLQGEDPVLKRPVALKVMRPELAADPRARQRFLREAQATAALDHHHIIHIYQVGEDRGVPFIAMPLLKGESLDTRLQRDKRLPVSEAVLIGHQIAEGLAVAHNQGLIHRDIKPANLWLEEEKGARGVSTPWGYVKILDFGLARAVGGDVHLTQTGAILGTPAYMAPEQAKCEPVDGRCDLFSLGAVLYRMLTGEMPFKGNDTMSLLIALGTETPKSVGVLNPEVPPALADLVKELLAKDPAQRPATARAVAERLEEIAGDQTMQLPSPRSRFRGKKAGGSGLRAWAGRRPWLAGAGAAVLLGLVVLLIWLPFRSSKEAPQGNPGARPAVATDSTKKISNPLGMKFALIPAGKFTMGSSPQEIERCINLKLPWPSAADFKAEGPEHEVEITKPFYLGIHPVTVGQFRQFVKESNCKVGDDRWQNPGFAQTDDHPVVWVSYDNAVEFCAWLSQKEAKQYRLPTEAEWEYGCRAGTAGTRYSFGDEEADLQWYAWYNKNGGGRTHPVGRLKPNAWGLYDMHGNVRNWCQDSYDPNYYQKSPKKDPFGGAGGERVVRGGTWNYEAATCRSAFRDHDPPDSRGNYRGFRVVLQLPSAGGDHP